MNSHQARIQTLIAEIDTVLQIPVPRLPWMGETVKDYRRVLERTRSYLGEIQPLLAEPKPEAQIIPAEPSPTSPQAIEIMRQSLMAEITGLMPAVMQPLKNDLEALQKERDSLLKEIRQLERQNTIHITEQAKQQQQIIAEFLQIFSSRLQETLSQQISQTLSKIEDQLLGVSPQTLEGEITPALPPVWEPSALYGQPSISPLHPQQRLANLLHLQQQTDQLLVSLDTTLSVVFEALLRNVHGYEESLSKGLDKMYSLGQQGEIMFTHLVNHLAQTLGQEAAGLLQTSISKGNLEPTNQPTQTETETETEKTIAPAKTSTTAKKKPKPTTQTPATTTTNQPEPKTEPTPQPNNTPSDNLAVDDLQQLLSNLELSTPEPAPQEPEEDNNWLDLFNTPENKQTNPTETPSSQDAEASPLTEEQLEDLYADLFGFSEPVENKTQPTQNISETQSIGTDLFEEALFGKQTEPDQTQNQPEADEDFLFFEPAATNTNPLNSQPLNPEQDNLDIFNELFPEQPAPSQATGTTDFSTPFSDESPIIIIEEPDPLALTDEWTADNFIPASPEESLLPVSEEINPDEATPTDRPRTNFPLENSNILEQLQDDLSLLASQTTSFSSQTTEDFDSPSEWTSLESLTPETSLENNPTLGEWAVDMGLSSTPAPTRNQPEPAPEIDSTLEEEPLLTSMEEWLSQLSQTQLSNIPTAPSNPEPAQVIKDTPNMTLDEAFASLGAAAAASSFSQPETPETEDLFPQPPGEQKTQTSANLTASTSPTYNQPDITSLDDLFASLNDSPQTTPEDASDLFDSAPIWNTTATSSQPNLDELGNLSLDDFFASLGDDSPSGNDDPEGDDLFSFGSQFSEPTNLSETNKKKP